MSNYILRAEKDINYKIHDDINVAKCEGQRLCQKEKMKVYIWKLVGEVRSKDIPSETIMYDE